MFRFFINLSIFLGYVRWFDMSKLRFLRQKGNTLKQNIIFLIFLFMHVSILVKYNMHNESFQFNMIDLGKLLCKMKKKLRKTYEI